MGEHYDVSARFGRKTGEQESAYHGFDEEESVEEIRSFMRRLNSGPRLISNMFRSRRV
jgi:hypothetical protein